MSFFFIVFGIPINVGLIQIAGSAPAVGGNAVHKLRAGIAQEDHAGKAISLGAVVQIGKRFFGCSHAAEILFGRKKRRGIRMDHKLVVQL